MANEALLRIKVVTDTAQAALGLDKASKQSSKFGSAMQKAALPAAAAGVALIALGKHALDSASTLQQAQGAVESVYGKSAAAVEKYAETSASSMGLAKSAYMNYAALVGAALQNSGFSAKQAADESNKIMQRAADMAATFGGTTADAVEAINAAVARGEYDPLEKYGVSLNATAVNAELAKRGQDKLTGAALKNAKATVALEQIYSNTSKAAGQFARESDTAAGSSAIASAEFENASAALGQALLPAAAATATALAAVAKWAGKNVGIVTALAAAIGVLVTAILIYNAAMKIAAIVQVAFNVAMSANVIFLVIIAIIALIAVIIIVVKKWDVIKAAAGKAFGAIMGIVNRVIQFIKKNWLTMIAVLLGPFGIAIALIIRNWDKIRAVVSRVTDAMKSAFRSVKDVAATVWSWISSKVTGVATAMKTAISGAVTKIKTWLGEVKTAANNLIPDGLASKLSAPFVTAKTAIDKVATAISSVVTWVGRLIDKIAGIHFPSVPSGLSKIAGKIGLNAVAPASAPRVFYSPAPSAAGLGATGTRAVVAGAGVTFNITGALDPEAVARQVGRLLSAHDRRMGVTVT